MSSAAQALANRQNSKHSTGPVTAAGKAASSSNATRHGLTSKSIVIPGEDPAEYDALRESLHRDFEPANEVEHTLVEEIAANSWRLNRARRHETAVLTKLIGDSPNPDLAFAEIFLEKPKELNRLLRYITSIERAYYRALNKLQAEQKARQIAENEIGFVSQPCLLTTGNTVTEPRPKGAVIHPVSQPLISRSSAAMAASNVEA